MLGAVLVASMIGAASPVFLTAAPAGATTAPVANETDLRNALADSSVDHIDLTQNIVEANPGCIGAFQRSSGHGDLVIDGHGLKIDGNGCPHSVLDLNNTAGETITLTHVTITGGNEMCACPGGPGGIDAQLGPLVLDHAAVIGNTTTNNTPPISQNGVSGGGIFSSGPVTLISSTVANNTAVCANCVGGSDSGAQGGGIWAGGLVTLVNSTVTGNATTGGGPAVGGGGIQALGGANLVYSTVVGNSSGAAGANINMGNSASVLTAFGSVVAEPGGGGANCNLGGSTTVSQGNNWEDKAAINQTCGFTNGAAHDHNDTTALQLGALGTNGGLTPTRMPTAPGSPLIDAIAPGDCNDGGAASVVTDQRDQPRPFFALGNCDIGAVETPQVGGATGTYTPLAPLRVLDTRNGTGLSGAFAPQQTRDLVVSNSGITGMPPDNGVVAVVLNVTATAPSAAGWLTLFPKDAPLPTASNLNFLAGQTVPNLVVVKVGTKDGSNHARISINNTGGNPAAGTVHVIADVVGYYGDATQNAAAGHFTPIAPTRILDTRTSFGLPGPFTPNQHQSLTVTGGATNVPDTASAVVMNVTATTPSAAGWLTLLPDGAPFPNASNLNFLAGQTVPNLAVVKTALSGGHGVVEIANTDVPNPPHPVSGTVHVIADVIGYFDTTVSTAVLMPPVRILDTRNGTGGVNGPVGPNAAITVDPRTAPGLPLPGTYKGVIVNVTATGPTQGGWLTAYPSDATLPNASNLNFVAGQTVPNLVQIGVGPDGKFKIANTDVPTLPHPSSGTVHVIVDLVGWYQ